DQQKHGQLALLDEALDEGAPHASGDIPVDGADFIARLVLAHLFEREAGSLENAVVFTSQKCLHGAPGPQLQAADLAHQFGGKHAAQPRGLIESGSMPNSRSLPASDSISVINS